MSDGTRTRSARPSRCVRRRVLLAALVALAAFVVAAVPALIAVSRAKALLGRQDDIALQLGAHSAGMLIDQWNTTQRDHVVALASLASIVRVTSEGASATATDIGAMQDALVSEQRHSSGVAAIEVINRNGIIMASSRSSEVFSDAGRQEDVQSALKGMVATSGITRTVQGGQPVVYYDAPIVDASGNVAGIVRVRATVTTIDQALSTNASGLHGARGVLVDQDGLVVVATANPGWMLRPLMPLAPARLAALQAAQRWGGAPAPAPLDQPVLSAQLNHMGASPFTWRLGGVNERSVAMPLSTVSWTFFAAAPRTLVSAPIGDLLRRALALALAASLIAACAWTALTLLADRQLRRLRTTAGTSLGVEAVPLASNAPVNHAAVDAEPRLAPVNHTAGNHTALPQVAAHNGRMEINPPPDPHGAELGATRLAQRLAEIATLQRGAASRSIAAMAGNAATVAGAAGAAEQARRQANGIASELSDILGERDKLRARLLELHEALRTMQDLSSGAAPVVPALGYIQQSLTALSDVSGAMRTLVAETNELALRATIEASRTTEPATVPDAIAAPVRLLSRRWQSESDALRAALVELAPSIDTVIGAAEERERLRQELQRLAALAAPDLEAKPDAGATATELAAALDELTARLLNGAIEALRVLEAALKDQQVSQPFDALVEELRQLGRSAHEL